MLAAYLTWHLRRAWASLCFTDEAPPPRDDPVAPARRSPAALRKASRQATVEGDVVHSFRTLLEHLATLARADISLRDSGVHLQKLAQPTPTQRRAFELLDAPVPLRIGLHVDSNAHPPDSVSAGHRGNHLRSWG
jgi:hypothetical protein